METLTLTRKAELLENGQVYGEWHIANEGIKSVAMHGMTLPIDGTVTQTLDAYDQTARLAILNQVEQVFPGMYK